MLPNGRFRTVLCSPRTSFISSQSLETFAVESALVSGSKHCASSHLESHCHALPSVRFPGPSSNHVARAPSFPSPRRDVGSAHALHLRTPAPLRQRERFRTVQLRLIVTKYIAPMSLGQRHCFLRCNDGGHLVFRRPFPAVRSNFRTSGST